MEPEACAKKLCFEDVSMHQPDVSFHRFQAACAREQPTVSGLRKVMADLGQTSQNFGNMVAAAGEKALGNSDADLKRVKFAVTSLKGGLVELDAQKRFLQALLEGQQSAPGDAESERWSDAVKAQKAELEALRGAAEQRVTQLTQAVCELELQHSRVDAQLACAEEAQRSAGTSRAAAARPLTPPGEADETLAAVREQLLSTQHALLHLEPVAASRLREAADAGSRLALLEAQLAQVEATAAAAERAAAPPTHEGPSTSTALLQAHAPAAQSQLTLQSASESAQYTSELCVLLRGLADLELLSARPEALTLRVQAHLLTVHLAPGTWHLAALQMEPPTLTALHHITEMAGGRVDVAVREVAAQLKALGHT